MIVSSNLETVRKEIKNAKKRPIIVHAHDDVFNRKILEYGKFDILLSPETGVRKNTLRTVDAGLNHILAKIAAKNNIAIGINLEEIKTLEKMSKAHRLTRVRAIIATCRKAKTNLAVHAKNKHETFHFLTSLGASSEQTSKAIVF